MSAVDTHSYALDSSWQESPQSVNTAGWNEQTSDIDVLLQLDVARVLPRRIQQLGCALNDCDTVTKHTPMCTTSLVLFSVPGNFNFVYLYRHETLNMNTCMHCCVAYAT